MSADSDNNPLRDARFVRALEHAPDADAAPDTAVRARILAAAHQAVANEAAAPERAPWWKSLWPFPSTGESQDRSRMPWDAAFATILVAGVVTLLWHGKEIPDGPGVARDDAPAVVAQAPKPMADAVGKADAVAVAKATPSPQDQPKAKEELQAREKKSESAMAESVARAQPEAADRRQRAAVADAESAAPRAEQMARSSQMAGGSAAGSVSAAPPVIAQAAPSVALAAPAAPAQPPAMSAAAPMPAAVPGPGPAPMAAPMAAPSAPARMAAAAPPPSANIANAMKPGAAIPATASSWTTQWNQMRVRSGSSTTVVTRDGAGRLPLLLGVTSARKDRAAAPSSMADKANAARGAEMSGFATAPPVVLELLSDSGSLGVYELTGDQWRFTPARSNSVVAQDAPPTEMGVMSPAQSQAVRSELTRLGLPP